MHHTRFVSAVLLVVSGACTGSSPGADVESSLHELHERPFDHVLLGVGRDADGKLRFVESKDREDGRRYAISVSREQREDGTIVDDTGLTAFAVRTEAGDPTGSREQPATQDSWPITAELADELAEVDPNDPVEILIRLRQPQLPEALVATELQRAIAEGRIASHADLRTERERILADRRRLRDPIKSRIEAHVVQLGGTVVGALRNLGMLVVRVSASEIEALANHPDILSVDLGSLPTGSSVGQAGDAVAYGSQIWLSIIDGYTGRNEPTRAVMIESGGGPREGHRGFELPGSSDDRLRYHWNCDSGGCTSVSQFTGSNIDGHALAVAGVLAGSIRDGQDSLITDTIEQRERSGYAEPDFGVIGDGGTGSGTIEAMNLVVDNGNFFELANISLKAPGSGCTGTDQYSDAANEMFETGILPVKSAGNLGTSSSCNLGRPGSAVGAFTVAGTGDGGVNYEWDDVRSASLWSGSSSGGTDGRTRVDMAAPACRKYLFRSPSPGVFDYGEERCGTSLAAPTVAGTMINFIDFWEEELGSGWVGEWPDNNPGVLYANALLWGDRATGGLKATSGFDRQWGAGRLKMRMYGGPYMDSPWRWQTNEFCVDHNEVVTLDVLYGGQHQAVPSSVDDIKAVVYWYDPRHDVDETLDNIDLQLRNSSTGSALKTSASLSDNKERVYASGIGGTRMHFEVKGQSVTADNVGCGTNSMRVYFAYFYEDDARNDSDGPDSQDVAPE